MKLTFREATQTDIPTLISLLADDPLGQKREDISYPLNARYLEAFTQIDADPNNELIVVVHENTIIGMLQLTFIPYLTHTGSIRCPIEGVRIDRRYRGMGLGSRCFQWAIERAKERGCNIVQLTSNKQRTEAIKFYKNLGFEATHEGFKLTI
jgi:ribosomal protein S18 acetylase RimI-like enzyme